MSDGTPRPEAPSASPTLPPAPSSFAGILPPRVIPLFPVELQVLWEGQDVRSLWLRATDPGCPVLGWGFLRESLAGGVKGVGTLPFLHPPSCSLLPAPHPPLTRPRRKNGAGAVAETLLLLSPSAWTGQWERAGDLGHMSFFAMCITCGASPRPWELEGVPARLRFSV